ncbi:Alanyl-tRNA synthetase [Mycoplasmopsis meleagridis]|uniref:Alanine--tRNA ligase n=1 Tax=Mycoplasmopsis meleagridis ATCC 25294 TaxID=1264554 RepID=A0A0F5H129_9BACT|nr:alanine--tRNA ligase [Mycoplasmopsis meleagridis]KKB26850.1 Alanyl-tRNA synthetase [Mycoplasmopsis meleagridis ATCC 25294]KUH47396.1 alanine--tRNA ligase [Mycoplasmopsis meleagridis]OAD18586.1 Alanyl-tRNA synthetase [Mycoplasmopsis meleagridis]VEU77411.1 Alanine--tRNA ligase [Mycoplasmopsis meleagridis]
MKKLNSKEIRQSWIDFFKSKDHLEIESKSLIPINDPSLLWINSGVATLKDYFSGKKIPPKNRLVNSQKAIRTNDIENVGLTARHHTFFEMLGNFSIGDYFKKEAIAYAFEYLTKILEIDIEKLFFTYFKDDLETKELWIKHGVKEDHLISGDRETNFWDIGSGPCGPNTEIFFDRGEKYDKRGIELLKNDIENDRYIEIWNIVFSTFNNDGENNYTELKQKNIDTGAGLERIASILQDAPTNYDSDLFINIIKEIEKFTVYKYDSNNYFIGNNEQELINRNFKIIADHLRTVVNAIADGAKISSLGRGYIIRRLIRRAIYKSMQLGIKEIFLHKLVKVVHDSLPFEYDVEYVSREIKKEEELFNKTINNGKEILDKYLQTNKDLIDGRFAFKMLDTYGFPIELTMEIASQFNKKINLDEFEKAKEEHSNKSRGSKVSGMKDVINSLSLIKGKIDNFIGYENLENQTKILMLLDEENEVDEIDGIGYLIIENTPFYATSGGQNHDEGYILQNGRKIEILDVFKDKYGNHVHKVKGKINKNNILECYVDKEKRLNLARNHSATHLVFSALRKVLGPQIEQLGSDITYERFTFDFPANEKPTDKQIEEIENIMQDIIKQNIKREYIITTTEEAKKLGAIMTIEETEYMDPKNVRMVKWGNITSDLCGGTHIPNSALMENFKIVEVERKQAGIFRIRVVTSNKLVDRYYAEKNISLAEEFNNILNKIKNLDSKYDFELELKNLNNYQKYLKLTESINKIREDFKKVNKENSNFEFDYENTKFEKINDKNIYINLEINSPQIKVIASSLREKYPNSYIILGNKYENEILLAIATKNENANALFQKIAKKLNGRGGGSPILAMGKINSIENIEEVIKEII